MPCSQLAVARPRKGKRNSSLPDFSTCACKRALRVQGLGLRSGRLATLVLRRVRTAAATMMKISVRSKATALIRQPVLTTNRIDLATSGLVVFGPSAAASKEINAAFSDRRVCVTKLYKAVVWGKVDREARARGPANLRRQRRCCSPYLGLTTRR